MNLEEIDQQYSAQIGRMSDSLEAAYDQIRESFDLTDTEREAAALEALIASHEEQAERYRGQPKGAA